MNERRQPSLRRLVVALEPVPRSAVGGRGGFGSLLGQLLDAAAGFFHDFEGGFLGDPAENAGPLPGEPLADFFEVGHGPRRLARATT